MFEKAVEHLIGEGRMITKAPIAIVFSIILGAYAVHWHMSDRLDGAKEEAARLDKVVAEQQQKIDDYKKLFPNETPQDLARRLESLEAKAAQRWISEDQERAIVAALKPAAGEERPTVGVYCICDSTETKRYAERILQVMLNAGWIAEFRGNYIAAYSEIIITGGGVAASKVEKLAAALRAQGIKTEARVREDSTEGPAIVVGMKE